MSQNCYHVMRIISPSTLLLQLEYEVNANAESYSVVHRSQNVTSSVQVSCVFLNERENRDRKVSLQLETSCCSIVA
jgi:hypothetical protein